VFLGDFLYHRPNKSFREGISLIGSLSVSTMLPRLLYAGTTTGSRSEKWLRLAEA